MFHEAEGRAIVTAVAKGAGRAWRAGAAAILQWAAIACLPSRLLWALRARGRLDAAAAAAVACHAGQCLAVTREAAARRALAAAPRVSSAGASRRLLDEFEVRCG